MDCREEGVDGEGGTGVLLGGGRGWFVGLGLDSGVGFGFGIWVLGLGREKDDMIVYKYMSDNRIPHTIQQ